MPRVALVEGGWFDADKARCWQEGTYHDGHNVISLATDSQWRHQQLLLTEAGTWVVNSWGGRSAADEYRRVTATEAGLWMVANEIENIPEELSRVIDDLQV